MTGTTSPATSPVTIAPWPSPRRAWGLTVVMFIAYAAALIDRQVISLLVDPMKRDLGFSDEQIGLLLGFAFAISYALCALPFGYLADRGSRRRVLAIGLTLWSVMTVACGFSKSFVLLGLARVGVGIGESVVAPTTLPMVADSFPPERRSMPMSICIAGAAVGVALAYPIGGLVVSATADMPVWHAPVIGRVFPWQLTFLVAGGLGAIVLMLLWFVKEPPRRSVRRETLPFREAFAHFWSRRAAYATVLLAPSVFAIGSMAFVAWMPANLARTHGLSHAQIGIWVGSVALPSAFAGPLLAGVITHWAARTEKMGLGLLATAVLMAASAGAYMAANIVASPVVSVLLFGSGHALSSAITTIPMMLLQNITPSAYRSQATAVLAFLYSTIGLGIGPLAVGMLTTHVVGEQRLGLALIVTMSTVLPVALLIIAAGFRSFAIEARLAVAAERLLDQESA